MNVDQEEIAKFEAMAAKWWDPEGEFKPLHAINPLRMSFIEKQTQLKDKKILDVGCGGGILSESMAQAGGFVTGMDLGESNLTVARLHAKASQVDIDYQCMAVEDLAQQQPHTFDVITCMEMLEHVPDPASIVTACGTLLKPDGWIFFSTLNRNPISFLAAIVGAEYILGLIPRGTHEYSKFIRPSELAAWMREANLCLQQTEGITYNLFTQTYQLTPRVDVNYMVSARPTE